MKQLKNAKSGLFLLELIFVILFFSLGKRGMHTGIHKGASDKPKGTGFKLCFSESIRNSLCFEIYRQHLRVFTGTFPHIQEKDGNFLVFYNQDYEECEEKDRFYTLHITRKTESHMQTARIQITRLDNKTSIYQLSLLFSPF